MKRLAAAGLTVIPVCVPVTPGTTVSLVVIDWLPAVFRVALKVWTPWSASVNVQSVGRTAWGSLLVK